MRFISYFIMLVLALSSTIALGADEAVKEVAKPGWLQQIPMYLEVLSQVFFGLMCAATVIVRVIPGKKDDEAVGKFIGKVQKYLGYLPTFGVNPRTKKLEAALADLKSQQEQAKK